MLSTSVAEEIDSTMYRLILESSVEENYWGLLGLDSHANSFVITTDLPQPILTFSWDNGVINIEYDSTKITQAAENFFKYLRYYIKEEYYIIKKEKNIFILQTDGSDVEIWKEEK